MWGFNSLSQANQHILQRITKFPYTMFLDSGRRFVTNNKPTDDIHSKASYKF